MVSMVLALSWILAPCSFKGRCQCFGKKVSIFRAEVKMETACFAETLALT
jgi:hypothetical protein